MKGQKTDEVRRELREDIQNSRATRDEIGIIHSIKFQLVAVIVAIIVCSILSVVTWLIPSASRAVSNMTKDYMEDMATAYGELIETEMKLMSSDILDDYDMLNATLQYVSVKAADSSYAYLVDNDGTMLYHPTKEKVGSPVENEVVSGVVKKLQNGEKVTSDAVEYEFKGVMKFAAYYVNSTSDYILVVTADEDDILAPIAKMKTQTLKFSTFIVLFWSVLGFFFATLIVKPIRRITKSVRKLAEMDFTPDEMQAKMNRRKDENGAMSRAITTLRNALAQMAVDIKTQSELLAGSSETLSTSAAETATTVGQVEKAVAEIADGAGSQAEETQKATENVIVMGNMVEETTNEVRELQSNAAIMKTSSEEATKTLEELNVINQRTRESIDIIYEQTNTTNESANKIREATTLIAEIAEETNLLSLNASIEAARAGDQGRGFAVVASQIQKLAEQSNDSARQIEAIIDSLIADSEKAVHTMEDVKEIMEEQSVKVEKTGEIFSEVKTRIDASIASVSMISDKTEKMDEARVNVVDIVQNLTAIAEENAASTEETSASVTEVGSIVENISNNAEQLKNVANTLDEQMSIFKI